MPSPIAKSNNVISNPLTGKSSSQELETESSQKGNGLSESENVLTFSNLNQDNFAKLQEWAKGMAILTLYESEGLANPVFGEMRGFEAKVTTQRLGRNLLLKKEESRTDICFEVNVLPHKDNVIIRAYSSSRLPTDFGLRRESSQTQFGEAFSLTPNHTSTFTGLEFFKGLILGAYLGGRPGVYSKPREDNFQTMVQDKELGNRIILGIDERTRLLQHLLIGEFTEAQFGDWKRFPVVFNIPEGSGIDPSRLSGYPIIKKTLGRKVPIVPAHDDDKTFMIQETDFFGASLPVAGKPDDTLILVLNPGSLKLLAACNSQTGSDEFSLLENFDNIDHAADFFRGVIAGYGTAYLSVQPIPISQRIAAKFGSLKILFEYLRQTFK